MSPLVERMQRELVARGNRLDERRPVLLPHRSLGLGIQHVAQCCRHLCVRPLAMLEAQAGTISCCSRGSKFRCCRSSCEPCEIAIPSSERLQRRRGHTPVRSEEHTSELQSLMRISYTVLCLKNNQSIQYHTQYTPVQNKT